MWRMNRLIGETTGRRMKSKSRIWEICFNASWPLDGCWEEHDVEPRRVNKTGQARISLLSFPLVWTVLSRWRTRQIRTMLLHLTRLHSLIRKNLVSVWMRSCSAGIPCVFCSGGDRYKSIQCSGTGCRAWLMCHVHIIDKKEQSAQTLVFCL